MNRIAMISGPALGHVGRLYKIALALREAYLVDIDFIYPDANKPYVQQIAGNSFKTFSIFVSGNNSLEKASCFAKGVEKHFNKKDYDLVIQDANPLLWTSLIKFPDIPKVNITNAFLTQLRPEPTDQETTFREVVDELNHLRTLKKLVPINNLYELYESDLVLLADPKPIVDLLGVIPEHYIQCGSCSWMLEGKSPHELADKNDFLLLSMGSTGKSDLNSQILEKIQYKLGQHTSIYVGNKVNAVRRKYAFDFLYEWLPLNEILTRSKAVITQGGAGATYQALCFGKPVFVFPAHNNHRILGKLLERLGVGLCIDEDTSVESIQKMDFVSISQAAINFSSIISKENGAVKIASEIGRIL